MNRASRLKEIHFYDWYISRWQTSDAHDELDATGRGIYREMLDVCYAQGSVTSNADILCRRCACTHQELEARWGAIRRHFQAHKKDKGKLVNKYATAFRRAYSQFRTSQARKGAKGGAKKGTQKSNDDSEIGSTGLATAKPLLKPEASLERERERERERELQSWSQAMQDLYEQFQEQYLGEIPDDLWMRFPKYVTGYAEELAANLPLWMKVRKYQNGYAPAADKFLRDGVWKKPPKPQQMGELPPEATRPPPGQHVDEIQQELEKRRKAAAPNG